MAQNTVYLLVCSSLFDGQRICATASLESQLDANFPSQDMAQLTVLYYSEFIILFSTNSAIKETFICGPPFCIARHWTSSTMRCLVVG